MNGNDFLNVLESSEFVLENKIKRKMKSFDILISNL